MKKLLGYDQQVIDAQTQIFAQGHHDLFLDGRQRREQVVSRVGPVMLRVAVTPPGNSGTRDMITSRQFAIADRGGCLLDLLADARCGGRRLMQFDIHLAAPG